MIPLSRDGASHFCQGFQQTTPALDMQDLYDTNLRNIRTFEEGKPAYSLYRDTLLRESDRSFFLAISCFRRALDLFTPASVFWAHVSLYYASFFAAQSVLGMFGCWVVGPRGSSRIVINTQRQAPGSQEFAIERKYPTQYSGTHQVFWDAYYNAMKNVALWTDPIFALAVTPINNNPTWPIDRRNIYNYQSSQAFGLMTHYVAQFNPGQFPASLQTDVNLQFTFGRTLLLFCAQKATEFSLRTDTHANFTTRAEAIRDLVYRATPVDLSGHAEEASLAI